MHRAEVEKLESISRVIDTHQDFDGVLAHFAGVIVAPRVSGQRVVECGCSTGVMTPLLLDKARELEVVEGSPTYAAQVESRHKGKLTVHTVLFEQFEPERRFEAAVVASVLHHVSDPVAMLKRIATWVVPGGSIHITVPNMNSFHRQLGVAMGVAQSVSDTSERNILFHQPGRFTQATLTETVRMAGLTVEEFIGFLFKPFPHDIMRKLALSAPILDGLFRMGIKYPELASQLYLQVRVPR
jgi:2-polyprenyl-3-methyl-5-hydroxy-6-metoxy-1,4-benzoquinol methylase